MSFRSSISVGSFQHVHVEASADVGEGEYPEAVLATLKEFVAQELRRAKDGDPVPRPAGRFRDLLEHPTCDNYGCGSGWHARNCPMHAG